jgi:hypothetical protein
MILEGCKVLLVLNVKTRVLWSVMPCNVSIGTTFSDDILHSEEKVSFFKVLVKFSRHIRARQWLVGAWTARVRLQQCHVSKKQERLHNDGPKIRGYNAVTDDCGARSRP